MYESQWAGVLPALSARGAWMPPTGVFPTRATLYGRPRTVVSTYSHPSNAA
jgi:hypothetical protein